MVLMVPNLILGLLLGTLSTLAVADIGPYINDAAFQNKQYGLFPTQNFTSNPNVLDIPIFNIRHGSAEQGSANGYIFLAPWGGIVYHPGPMIFDSKTLALVWSGEGFGTTLNFRVQKYKGTDYLTFWSGSFGSGGYGEGHYYMLDSSYEIAYNLSAVGDTGGDFHEFFISNDDTALVTLYHLEQADLSEFGVENGWVLEGRFQEIDIETNELLFEWRSTEHVSINETYQVPKALTGNDSSLPFDYFHINAIDKDEMGNYIISSRNTGTLYYIDGDSGEVIWRMGGRLNEFEDLSNGNATNFIFQHNVEWYPGDHSRLTLFDNHDDEEIPGEFNSRGIILKYDDDAMTAELEQEFVSPNNISAASQGDVQILGNSNAFIGWGQQPVFSEFTADGELLWDVQFGILDNSTVQTYRAFKMDWVGRPNTKPDIAVGTGEDSGKLFMSWNGATELKSWALLASNGTAQMHDETFFWQTVTATGFETTVTVGDQARYVIAVPLDGNGNVL
ncbi:ASST-domain-containing protein, partial [Lineolata rhizophorae]